MTLTAEKKHEVSQIDGKIDLIKRMYCKNCTNDEIEIFIHACKRTGLDPFSKQIYAIKRGGMLTIQTGIDGLRLIAERTGNYSPGRESTFSYDEKNNLVSATSYIKKRTPDNTWHEVAACVYFDEYNAKQGLWQKMPRVMLAKCAEANALRKAFPAEMSGLYSSEEMDQACPETFNSQKTEITDQEWAELDSLVMDIKDEEYLNKLAKFVNVDSLSKIHPKDYDRVLRSLTRKLQEKEVIHESEAIA